MTNKYVLACSILGSALGVSSLQAKIVTPMMFATNINGNSVSSCTMNHSGLLTSCVDSGASFSQPGGITTLTLGSQTYAYVGTAYTNNVTQCQVDLATGLFSNCQTTGSIPSTYIVGISFHTVAGQIYAYVANGDIPGSIYQCAVDGTTGLFSGCAVSGPSFANGPLLPTIEKFNSKNYIYVPDGNNGNPGQQVWQCKIHDGTGSLPAECVDSGAGAIFNGPAAIAFVNMDGANYAYVSGYNAPYLFICPVDATTGQLQTCTEALGDIGQPNGVQSLVVGGTTYLYLANTSANTVVQCTVQLDGSLTDCAGINPDSTFNGPFALAFGPR